ncbi:membrane protein [Longimycelium tulufanense]|uniref:Membrane protein n=1 Tax=Longimycelium tulufanense TaxID=907463 RepID=A0A8J3CED6_9PSEU|nr:DUF3159 domain-containing protein [Longimycelium tulufanense]GGM55050.1 membrane protein [Longimycelium tulufanense]
MSEPSAGPAEPAAPPAHSRPASPTPPADTEDGPRQQTLLEMMGGVHGLIYSTVPVLVFILVNVLAGLTPAIWAAVGSGVAIAGWRLVRREPVQPAVSGLFGVAIAAFIAHRTGEAKGFFLFGIWVSLVYGGAFALSALVRWPLVGVVWSVLNGSGFAWRSDRRVLLAYDLATLAWVAVFGARFVVQNWLYETDQTGWLAAARIGMGWPLAGLAFLVTIWAVRRDSAARRAATAEG